MVDRKVPAAGAREMGVFVADRAHGLDRRFERRCDKAARAFEEMMARNKIDVATAIKKAIRGCVDKVGDWAASCFPQRVISIASK